jgi:hypothetical protein
VSLSSSALLPAPAVIIRTSDRALFKRCRRKWHFGSALQRNRTISQPPSYFWFGTVGHFALEDYHGYNKYGHPVEAAKGALKAMKVASKKNNYELPDDYQEQFELLCGVLEHYLTWNAGRELYKTYWYNKQPQLEVKARIPIPIKPAILQLAGYSKAYYEVTFDRIVESLDDGELWVQDYKFFKQFNTEHLDYDSQASSYTWGASCLYPKPIAGFMYLQFRKVVPELPERTSKGQITTNMQVLAGRTTHSLYREAVIDMYGDVSLAPPQYKRVLGELAILEHEDGDAFIKRTKTTRTPEQIANEGQKILMELPDMLSPRLALYPNPTKDCHWECEFRDICQMVERNEDWEFELEQQTIDRSEENLSWRKFVDPR